MNRILLALALMFAPALAHAYTLPYATSVYDTYNAGLNALIANYNANTTPAAYVCSVTGSAGASTCNGLRVVITTASLTTAASTTYTETLTDSAIAATSQVNCQAGLGTSTTGVPVAASVVPAAGSAVIKVQNVSTGAALNGTITLACQVWN